MAFCALVSIRCTREEFNAVPASGDVLTSLNGSWKIRNVIQTDEAASGKSSPYISMNITSLFPYTEYKLTLNGTAGAVTGTFTAVPGNAPPVIPFNTGNWEVDNPKNPQVITFTNGSQEVEMKIGSYPSSFNPAFKLTQTKLDMAVAPPDPPAPAITYEYEFVKQ